MLTNKNSAVLSGSDKTSALAVIRQLKQKLPFLLSFRGQSRKNGTEIHPERLEYMNQNLQAARSFRQVLPANVDIAEFERDIRLLDQLMPVRTQLAALLDDIDHTIQVTGSDALQTSDIVYSYLKTASKHNAGIKALTENIAKWLEAQDSQDTAIK